MAAPADAEMQAGGYDATPAAPALAADTPASWPVPNSMIKEDPKEAQLSTEEIANVMRRRARTHSCFIEQRDVELLVQEHSALDHTFLSSLGKHRKVMRWKILVAGLPDPIDLEVHVDKSIALQPQVSVTANGERIFPKYGDKEISRMTEDFTHRWTFRGVPDKFRLKHEYEVKPSWPGCDEWFPATLTSRRQEDGTYEANVLMLNTVGGIKQDTLLVGLKAEDIRHSDTKKSLELATRTLLLSVPKDKPWDSSLMVLDEAGQPEGRDVTKFFGRWTPGGQKLSHCDAKPVTIAGAAGTPNKVSPKIALKVCKNSLGKDLISVNVGHSVLQHFMSGQVHAISCDRTQRVSIDHVKLKKSWKIQVGPFVEHEITIERKNRLSKIMTLSIDGSTLVEATYADISGFDSAGKDSDEWSCAFRLIGDKFLEFALGDAHTYKELAVKKAEEKVLPKGDDSAYPDDVSTPIRCTYECNIVMKDINHIGKARLYIDQQEFSQLHPKHDRHKDEKPIANLPAEVMRSTYNIIVPQVVMPNTLMRGLAWPVQHLTTAHANLPSADEVSNRTGQMAKDAGPMVESFQVHGGNALKSLHDGLGNFMSSLGSLSNPFSIAECSRPQIKSDYEEDADPAANALKIAQQMHSRA